MVKTNKIINKILYKNVNIQCYAANVKTSFINTEIKKKKKKKIQSSGLCS
jgi:hypothetical protein